MATSNEPAPGAAASDHAEVAFHPPLLLVVCLVAGFLARWLVPASFLPRPLASWGGPILTAASIGLFAWAVTAMLRGGGSIPTDEPTEAIVERGPYRLTRNPIYLSMVLLQVGVAVWANSPWFLALAALSAWLLWWGVISREEGYLQRKFGDEYTAYRASVRRWL